MQEEVIALHEKAIAADGGEPGILNPSALESALFAPRRYWYYTSAPTIIGAAAVYIHRLCFCHAFFDGNKRTALASGMTFLDLNGLKLPHYPHAETLMIDLALKEIGQEELEHILSDFASAVEPEE
ncbi:MAG: type II toxin-antitoxin system death-on-curing family toxin [Puniceicoccales bacterium]|nr:type II toxin-antitoxin system death-on-curing family toxin [Puniceicoccales bacterium]